MVPKVPVIDTEITAPGGDEVSFVDNHQTKTALSDKIADVVGQKQLRRHVQNVYFSFLTLIDDAVSVNEIQLTVKVCHLLKVSIAPDGKDLVFHQCNQGRYYYGNIALFRDMKCRQLKQKRFTGAGRGCDKHIIGHFFRLLAFLIFVDNEVNDLPLGDRYDFIAFARALINLYLAEIGLVSPVAFQQIDSLASGNIVR